MNIGLVQQVLAALERERVRYVVFGAVALALHGIPRATEDLDLFIQPDRDNIERLKVALRSVFDDPHIDEITADDLLGEYPAIQYGPPNGPFHIDLLTRLGELYDFESLETERVLFGDVSVCVVTPKMRDRPAERPRRRGTHRGTLRPWRRLMPVRKFRDVSEIEEPTYERGTRELYEVIRHVWGLSDQICPLRFPEGVFRHRSIEEAEALRKTWEDANFERHRERLFPKQVS